MTTYQAKRLRQLIRAVVRARVALAEGKGLQSWMERAENDLDRYIRNLVRRYNAS